MSRLLLAAAGALGAACGGGDAGGLSAELADAGVDITALFAPPTPDELSAIRADWASRDLAPNEVTVEVVEPLEDGELRVLGHTVDGHRHYGAVYIPDGEGPFPVANSWIGFGPPFEFDVTAYRASPEGMKSIVVLPSFRGHTLRLGEQEWVSGGPRFDQCDGGGDDALAFLNVVLQTVPSADPSRVVVAGGSRGANVGLLAGARDERVRAVGAIAPPTSYLVRTYLDHPNLEILYREWFVAGLLDGTGDLAEARREMLLCSPLYFADAMPPVQLHHGEQDRAVPVASAQAYQAAWSSDAPLEVILYPTEGHAFVDERTTVEAHLDTFFERHLDL